MQIIRGQNVQDWLVRTGTSTVEVNPQSTRLIVGASRGADVSFGDRLVLLEVSASSQKFTHHTRVIGASKLPARESTEAAIAQVDVESWEQLSEPLSLEDLRYSLTFLTNREQPWLHLRRGIRHLPSHDFETILSAEIFVARTGYFGLLGAIPDSMQREFAIERLQQIKGMHHNPTYAQRFNELRGFIARRIEAVGYQLAQLARTADQLAMKAEDDFRVKHAYVREGADERQESRSIDYLDLQLRSFQRYFRSLKEQSLVEPNGFFANIFDEIEKELASRDHLPREREFEWLFAKFNE